LVIESLLSMSLLLQCLALDARARQREDSQLVLVQENLQCSCCEALKNKDR